LDFATISTHQQADTHLQQIKQSNNDYEARIIGWTCQWYCRGWFESLSRNIQHSVIDSIYTSPKPLGHNLSYHVPHHIIFLLVIMIHTSGLSPRTPSLLENPFTFFTNTCHTLQC
jgi:hypothetical protein